MNAPLAHAEDGSVIESVPFPFEEIYAQDESQSRNSDLGPDVQALATILAVQMLNKVLRWQFQNGMNNPNGLIIRCKVLCWNVLPEVQDSYNLTELAGETRQDKQSFGRWQDDFKKQFPKIANFHKRAVSHRGPLS